MVEREWFRSSYRESERMQKTWRLSRDAVIIGLERRKKPVRVQLSLVSCSARPPTTAEEAEVRKCTFCGDKCVSVTKSSSISSHFLVIWMIKISDLFLHFSFDQLIQLCAESDISSSFMSEGSDFVIETHRATCSSLPVLPEKCRVILRFGEQKILNYVAHFVKKCENCGLTNKKIPPTPCFPVRPA